MGAEVKIGGKTFYKLPGRADALPMNLYFGLQGDYFLLAIGDGVVEGMQSRLAAKKTPAWLTGIKGAGGFAAGLGLDAGDGQGV